MPRLSCSNNLIKHKLITTQTVTAEEGQDSVKKTHQE